MYSMNFDILHSRICLSGSNGELHRWSYGNVSKQSTYQQF